MRAAAILVALLCCTLPIVRGEAKGSTTCLGPLVITKGGDGNNALCAVVFKSKGQDSCAVSQQKRTLPTSTDLSTLSETCRDEGGSNTVVCYCKPRNCNANTNEIAKKFHDYFDKTNHKQRKWLGGCKAALADSAIETKVTQKQDSRMPEGKPKNKKSRTNAPKGGGQKGKPGDGQKKNTSPRPANTDGTGSESKEVGPNGSNKQKSTKCFGDKYYLPGAIRIRNGKYENSACALVFSKDKNGDCVVVQEERVYADSVEPDRLKCEEEDEMAFACFCTIEKCNAYDTFPLYDLGQYLGKRQKMSWQQKCPQVLHQIGRKGTPGVDRKPATHKTPKTTQKQAPPTTKAAKTTTVAKSDPKPTTPAPSKQASTRCLGEPYRPGKGTTNKEYSYCGYLFSKGGKNGCAADPREVILPGKANFSSQKPVICQEVNKDGPLFCYCKDDNCNENTAIFSEQLGNIQKKLKGTWKEKCGQVLNEKGVVPKESNKQESTKCFGEKHYMPGTVKETNDKLDNSICVLVFSKDKDGGCLVVPQERVFNGLVPLHTLFTKCQKEEEETFACFCFGEKCNGILFIGRLRKYLGNDTKATWQHKCPQVLDPKGTPEVEHKPTPHETPKTTQKQAIPTTKPAKTTTAAKSDPVPAAIPSKTRCLGEKYRPYERKGAHSYCGYLFSKAGENGCAADPREVILPEKVNFSSQKPVICREVNKDGPLFCYFKADKCNENTAVFSKQLGNIQNQLKGTWKENCRRVLNEKVTTPEAIKEAKTTTAPARGAPPDSTEPSTSSSRPQKTDSAKTTGPSLQDTVTTTDSTTSTISTSESTTTSGSTTAKEPETNTGSSDAPISTKGIFVEESRITPEKTPEETTEGQTGIDGNGDNYGSLPEGEGGKQEENGKKSGSTPGWLIALIILLAIFVVCVIVGGFILYSEKKGKKKEVIEEKAAPPAATPPVQPAQVAIPVEPPVNPVAPAPTAPAARQPTQREKVMMQKWQDQLKLNSELKAAENAAKIAPVAAVAPEAKKDEEVLENRRPDEGVPEVEEKATQDENSQREASKVEVKKERKEEEVKETQETMNSVKTQPSESVKTAKKISEKEVQKKEE